MRVAGELVEVSLLLRFLRQSDKIKPNTATKPIMKTATINGEGKGKTFSRGVD